MSSGDQPSNPDIFLLPDLGEGLEEAELVEWRVKVGQVVEDLDILATVETAKASMDVTSPRSGTIAQLHGKPGEVIKVGAPMVSFAGSGGSVSPAAASPAVTTSTQPAESDERSAVAAQKTSAVKTSPPPARTAPAPAVTTTKNTQDDPGGSVKQRGAHAADAATAQPGHAAAPVASSTQSEDAGTVVGSLGHDAGPAVGGQVRAAPAVRRLARDLGVDITRVTGTGIGGRITNRDVHAAAADVPPEIAPDHSVHGGEAGLATPPSPTHPHARQKSSILWPSTQESGLPPRRIPTLHRKETPPIPQGKESMRIPLRGVRRIIAQHLRHSIGHAVHFTIMDDADITALDDLRRRFTEIAREKVTLLPFIAAAVCRVLSGRDDPKFNRLNATVDDENHQIIQHRTVHLGIATDTEEGLMVPVIKDADELGVLEMSRNIRDLAKKARDRQIKRAELVGSTFTISNFGSLHGRYGTPIINYPESCILAVGRAREGVVVRNHMIGVGMQLPLSLSADHRVVDGGTAAQALARIIELLQNPDELLPSRK